MRYPSLSRSLPLLLCSLAALASACGGGKTEPDAAPMVDAPPLPRVQRVNCPASVAVEITEIASPSTGGYAYSPNPATIRAGEVVKFRSGTMHTTRSNVRGLFEIDYGQTECFRFNTKETHNFNCTAHGFAGSIIVQ